MKIMAASNIYEAGAVELFDLFGDYIEGSAERIALLVSTRCVGDAATRAIDKSLAAFGYGTDACSYVTLFPRDDQVEGADISLDPHALFLLIEGIDPLFLICADEGAVALASEAYRTPFAESLETAEVAPTQVTAPIETSNRNASCRDFAQCDPLSDA